MSESKLLLLTKIAEPRWNPTFSQAEKYISFDIKRALII